MKKDIVKSLTNEFESYVNFTNHGVEFWFARDLQHLLGYSEWRNFKKVIHKAMTACETSGQAISDHFVDVNKMVSIGSDTQREIIPEELPPEEDIKKLHRRLTIDEKNMLKGAPKLDNGE